MTRRGFLGTITAAAIAPKIPIPEPEVVSLRYNPLRAATITYWESADFQYSDTDTDLSKDGRRAE